MIACLQKSHRKPEFGLQARSTQTDGITKIKSDILTKIALSDFLQTFEPNLREVKPVKPKYCCYECCGSLLTKQKKHLNDLRWKYLSLKM